MPELTYQSPMSAQPKGFLRTLFWEHFGFWLLLVLGMLIFQANRIHFIGFNIIEVLLGKSLFRGWGYIFAPLDPPGLSRPFFASFLCGLFELIIHTPVGVYRALYVFSLTSFAASSFYVLREIGGPKAAHAALLLFFLTPAFMSFPFTASHFASHLALMSVFGWAIWVTLRSWKSKGLFWGILSGLLWGCVFLSRYEMITNFVVALSATILCTFNRQLPLKSLRVPFWLLLGFLCLFIPKQLYFHNAAKKYNIIEDAGIYTFYHGEVHSLHGEPVSNGDNLGFILSSKIYGTVEDNRESLFYLILHHPKPVLARFARNARRGFSLIYQSYVFFLTPCFFFLLIFFTRSSAKYHLPVIFFMAMHLASSVILLFHIDPRYLIPQVLPLFFVVALSFAALVEKLSERGILHSNLLKLGAFGILVVCAIQIRIIPPVSDTPILNGAPFTELGRFLKSRAPKEFGPVVQVEIAGMDPFLLQPYVSYFADTAIPWTFQGPVPLDRLAALTVKPIAFRLVSESLLPFKEELKLAKPLLKIDTPKLESLYLFQYSPNHG